MTVRQDFPFLNNNELIYFDNAATAQRPQTVIDAINDYYLQMNVSVHRSTFQLAYEATQQYEHVRKQVADFIHAESPEEVVFTKGTTQSLNWVAFGFAKQQLHPGDEILISQMEHHSNLVVWQQIAVQTGAILKYIPLTADQTLDMKAAAKLITSKTKILAITGASNVLGVITPVDQLSQLIHQVGGYFIVDGAQLLPTKAVDVVKADIDFLAFSGHKLFGPTGIGVLYGKSQFLQQLEPQEFGGEMIDEVTEQTATFQQGPAKFEAGTQNVAGVFGLGAAIAYLEQLQMSVVEKRDANLGQYLADQLRKIEGVEVYGPQIRQTGIVAFNLEQVHAHDVASVLDMQQICVRAGQHCAQPLMAALHINACVRASLAFYNTQDECDLLVAAVKQAKEFFTHD